MYVLVRITICCCVYLLFLLSNKMFSKANIKKPFIIAIVLCLFVVLNFVPFENCFVTFNTVDSSLKYSNMHSSSTNVEGNHSTLTLFDTNHSNKVLIVPKKDDGWKIGRGIDTNRIDVHTQKSYSINLFYHREMKDYYIVVYDAQNNILTIEDNKGTLFEKIAQSENAGNSIQYAAFIDGFDNSYSITINGERYNINMN